MSKREKRELCGGGGCADDDGEMNKNKSSKIETMCKDCWHLNNLSVWETYRTLHAAILYVLRSENHARMLFKGEYTDANQNRGVM